jgi:hypothetical protein
MMSDYDIIIECPYPSSCHSNSSGKEEKPMKRILCLLLLVGSVFTSGPIAAGAEPLRILLLDFSRQSALASDPGLGGYVNPEELARSAVYLLGEALTRNPAYVLLDRRDFVREVDVTRTAFSGLAAAPEPSFLHAAQALRADCVLRGQFLSFSSGKRVVNQGGYRTEFVVLSLRVALEALDATDGTVVAMADGVASMDLRQTDEVQTVIGQDESVDLLRRAISQALPDLDRGLGRYVEYLKNRPTVLLTVTTSADPALVEIDAVLVGTTPLEKFTLYKGDHIITVGKPGFRDITKRILFNNDTRINVPMLRVTLSADEIKELMKDMRINAFVGMEPAIVIQPLETSK